MQNLEVAAAEVALKRKKEFGVIIIGEKELSIGRRRIDESLPHMQPHERRALYSHYLGCVTWEKLRHALCATFDFPDTIDDAVVFCAQFRQTATSTKKQPELFDSFPAIAGMTKGVCYSSHINVPSFTLRLLEMRINASTEMFSLPASTRLTYTVDSSALSASFS